MRASTPSLSLVHDDDRGRLTLGGQAYLLVRPETLAPLFSFGDRGVLTLLEAGGREGGRLAARSVMGRGLETREALEAILAVGGEIGWGKMSLLEWSAERIRIAVRSSPFAESASDARAPVCHLTRGVFAGVISTLEGVEAHSVETACEALGAGFCCFEVRR